MRSADFIDEIRRVHDIDSDNKTASLLGLSSGSLSLYRNGKREFGEDLCVKVADLLDIDVGYVMTHIAATKAKRPEIKRSLAMIADMAKARRKKSTKRATFK